MRTRCFVVTLLLVLVSAHPPPTPAGVVSAQSDPVITRNNRLGLAHVDLMDLHAQRRQDEPPLAIELQPGADVTDRYDRAVDSGAAWHRWSLYWDLIDRGGTYAWSVSDGIVSRDVARGMRTLGVLHGNPPGVRHFDGKPPGIDQPVFQRADGTLTDDPQGVSAINPGNTWARFVAAVVERYRPGGSFATARGWSPEAGVRHWEIGNEPNLPHFWPGTPADFVRFLEVGYLAAKWSDPAAVIAHGGIANDANAGPWFAAFADALRARAAASPVPGANNYYFDRSAWHWYTQVSNLTVRPERARSILTERGLPTKPIWVTEFGVPVWSEYPGPCWDPSSPRRASAGEQSAFVWQSVAEGLAASVELMVYFQLFDDCGNGTESYDAFGLVRNHAANQCWSPPNNKGCWQYDPALAGMPRAAYDAYRTIARELSGASVVEAPRHAGWSAVVFSRPPGARVTVAWNTTGRDRTVALAASSDRATLFELDAAGQVRTRAAQSQSGRFDVVLPGVTNRNGHMGRPLTAGRPVILVEQTALAVPGAGADRAPPYIAVVGALPDEVPTRFDLTVVAGDEHTTLGAFQVFFTRDNPPGQTQDWTPIGSVLPWPGAPSIGQVALPFVGAPGVTYYFAARAADTSGNWTALPPYAQAATRVAGQAARQRSFAPVETRPGRAVEAH